MARGVSGSASSGCLTFLGEVLSAAEELGLEPDEPDRGVPAVDGGSVDGPFMMRVTCSTVGARWRTTFDRERTYLWRAAYSRAEMV